MPASRIVTLPNLLSITRVPLAVAFVATGSVPVRVGLVCAASLTDMLDGWLARRGQMTQLGALLDPIADKTFMLVAISAFLIDGAISTGDYLIVLSRDLMIGVGFIVAFLVPGLDPRAFKARWPGKAVTVCQMASLFVLLVRPAWFRVVLPVLAVASAVAIIDYTLVLHRQRRDRS